MTDESRLRFIVRGAAAAAFMAAGTAHFLMPALFVRIVPPILPQPLLWVRISGGCEIAGGIGLLVRPLRRPAAWGLIALLVAVFPANIYMAVKPDRFADLKLPVWALWARLPLQALFIAMVYLAGGGSAGAGAKFAETP